MADFQNISGITSNNNQPVKPFNNGNYLPLIAGQTNSTDNNSTTPQGTKPKQKEDTKDISGKTSNTSNGTYTSSGKKLTSEQEKQVADLKKTDQKVKTHEQAHIAAGGALVRSGANYTYQTGPDGTQYAVGGEVTIDTSTEGNNPEKTIEKMEQIKRAALAPADPSPQDRSVAAMADKNEAEARMALINKQRGESSPKQTSVKSALEVYSKYQNYSSGESLKSSLIMYS